MKVCVMTLGCKVNKYESDSLMQELYSLGFETTDKLEPADFYVVNTCAVTNEAEKKSRQMMARCKKYNENAKFFICGCASQKNREQFLERGAYYVCGTSGKRNIVEIIEKLAKNDEKSVKIDQNSNILPEKYENMNFALQTRTRAFIKIQDGCNNFCTYCIIPYLRGRSRSRELSSILRECESLGDGVKEIVLTGINVTDFQVDGKNGLLLLLQELDKLGKRIRLSSIEDTLVDEEFVSGLAKLKNFCPHFHLSLQSGSDGVLKRMNRHYKAEDFAKSVELIRKHFPLPAITTDVIVGFPQETDEEFSETLKFVKKVNFSALHIFQFSMREGTAAQKLYKDLSPQIKQKRSEMLEEVNKKLKNDFIASCDSGEVLVEEKEGKFFVGHTKNYIKCFIESEKELTGKVVKVKIEKPFEDGALASLM